MTSNSKEWIQYLTASVMVLSGIVLAFWCFGSKGEVSEGVLWYVAQALTFAGGIFGVSIYFRTKLGETKSEIMDYIQKVINRDKDKE